MRTHSASLCCVLMLLLRYQINSVQATALAPKAPISWISNQYFRINNSEVLFKGTSKNLFTDKFALILRNSSSFNVANIANIRHSSLLLLLDQIKFVSRKLIFRGALKKGELMIKGISS